MDRGTALDDIRRDVARARRDIRLILVCAAVVVGAHTILFLSVAVRILVR